MPCEQVGHSHDWPASGHLSILECERFCGFCMKEIGPNSAHRYSTVRELRKHVERCHVSDVPDLTTSLRKRDACGPDDLRSAAPGKEPKRASYCETLGHEHEWVQEGELTIFACERICLFCINGWGQAKRTTPFYDASSLRDHVQAKHMSDFPNLRLVLPNGLAQLYHPVDRDQSRARETQGVFRVERQIVENAERDVMRTASNSNTSMHKEPVDSKQRNTVDSNSGRTQTLSFAKNHFLGILNVCREMDMSASDIHEIVMETMGEFYDDDSMNE